MPTDPIVIALAADRNFVKQLAVVVASISTVAAGRRHRIFIFHDGYDGNLVNRIESVAAAEIEISWLDGRSPGVASARLPQHLPPSTLFRLRIAEVISEHFERVIYLDTDIIVRHSLDELWDTELDGTLLAAVRDAERPWAGLALAWRELRVSPDTPYFNAGVLVIPTRKWREEQVATRALS